MKVIVRVRGVFALLALVLAFSGLLPTTADALQGGPDAFGYRYIDSNSVGGPKYVWQDIEKTGTDYRKEYGAIDDYVNGGITKVNSVGLPIPIGFSFDFYGQSQKWVFLAGNGYITFSTGIYRNYVYDGSGIPSKLDPNNLIAPFWGWNDTYS